MRPSGKEQAAEWGRRSGEVQRVDRLAAALNFAPVRPVEDVLVFEVRTFNPFSGQRHLLELKHGVRNGNDRFDLWIDGTRQRNQWSRWGFVHWMFRKIDSVRADWE